MKAVHATGIVVAPVPCWATGWRRYIEPQRWRLVAPCRVTLFDRVITIPSGMEFDFASVPRFLRPMLPDAAIFSTGATAHDFLYQHGTCSKWIADAVFYELLRSVDRVPRWHAIPMWLAVALFGWPAWRSWRKKEA